MLSVIAGLLASTNELFPIVSFMTFVISNAMGEADIKPCAVCGTEYENGCFVMSLTDKPSHIKYHNCPTCGYSEGIPASIKKVLETSAKTASKGILNISELSDLIVKDLIADWPQPKK